MKAAVALALIFLCFWNCDVKAANKKATIKHGDSCQTVRGVVKCEDPKNKNQHDKKTVLVRLSTGSTSRKTLSLDEGYSSQNGQFEVFGCTENTVDQWEIDILHFCKANKARQLIVKVPKDESPEYNISTYINLKAHFDDEAAFDDNIQLPCALI